MLMKVALRREEGWPIGKPAPCYFICPCGARVPVFDKDGLQVGGGVIDRYGVVSCQCGQKFRADGYLLPSRHSVRVHFEDGNTITTSINGTRAEIEAYYVGKRFQFGDTDECPRDKMVKAVRVEFLEGAA